MMKVRQGILLIISASVLSALVFTGIGQPIAAWLVASGFFHVVVMGVAVLGLLCLLMAIVDG